MIKIAVFAREEAEKASQFIAEHGVTQNGIKVFENFTYLMYNEDNGMVKSEVLAFLNGELRKAQGNRLSQEFEYRFWKVKAMGSLKGSAEQEANVNLTKAGKDIEATDLDIRTLKGIIADVEKGTFMPDGTTTSPLKNNHS